MKKYQLIKQSSQVSVVTFLIVTDLVNGDIFDFYATVEYCIDDYHYKGCIVIFNAENILKESDSLDELKELMILEIL